MDTFGIILGLLIIFSLPIVLISPVKKGIVKKLSKNSFVILCLRNCPQRCSLLVSRSPWENPLDNREVSRFADNITGRASDFLPPVTHSASERISHASTVKADEIC